MSEYFVENNTMLGYVVLFFLLYIVFMGAVLVTSRLRCVARTKSIMLFKRYKRCEQKYQQFALATCCQTLYIVAIMLILCMSVFVSSIKLIMVYLIIMGFLHETLLWLKLPQKKALLVNYLLVNFLLCSIYILVGMLFQFNMINFVTNSMLFLLFRSCCFKFFLKERRGNQFFMNKK